MPYKANLGVPRGDRRRNAGRSRVPAPLTPPTRSPSPATGGAPWRHAGTGGVRDRDEAGVVDEARGRPSPTALPPVVAVLARNLWIARRRMEQGRAELPSSSSSPHHRAPTLAHRPGLALSPHTYVGLADASLPPAPLPARRRRRGAPRGEGEGRAWWTLVGWEKIKVGPRIVGPVGTKIGRRGVCEKNITFFWQKRSPNCDFYSRSTLS
jgi:hypothetical protein